MVPPIWVWREDDKPGDLRYTIFEQTQVTQVIDRTKKGCNPITWCVWKCPIPEFITISRGKMMINKWMELRFPNIFSPSTSRLNWLNWICPKIRTCSQVTICVKIMMKHCVIREFVDLPKKYHNLVYAPLEPSNHCFGNDYSLFFGNIPSAYLT